MTFPFGTLVKSFGGDSRSVSVGRTPKDGKHFKKNEDTIRSYLEDIPTDATARLNEEDEYQGRDEILDAFETYLTGIDKANEYLTAEVEKDGDNRILTVQTGEIEEATTTWKEKKVVGYDGRPNAGTDKPRFETNRYTQTEDHIVFPTVDGSGREQYLNEVQNHTVEDMDLGEPIFELEVEYRVPEHH